MDSFFDQEQRCSLAFSELGPCWHLYTPEDHPILFTRDDEFKMAMNLMALCTRLFPQVRILTFEWMSNHLHTLSAGREGDIMAQFALLVQMLRRHLKNWGRPDNLPLFEPKLRPIDGLDDARNVLVYNNRNGFLVMPTTSPFSYPWGANRYYFNDDAKNLFYNSQKRLTIRQIRECARGRFADKINPVRTLDGYACPMDFCDIEAGERLFRNARHYFYTLSRNIESQKRIAEEISERIFYTDDELFNVLVAYGKNKYGIGAPGLLPVSAKTELAKMMHFEYHAGNKQIQRMLKLDAATVESWFPRQTPTR